VQWAQGQDVVAMTGLGPCSRQVCTQRWRDLLLLVWRADVDAMAILLLESALLQKTTALSSLAGSPRTSCSCTAKR
jgi:hypothetical protein